MGPSCLIPSAYQAEWRSHAVILSAVFDSAVEKLCFSRPPSPRDKPPMLALYPPQAQSATGLVIVLLRLVEAYLRWLILRLAIAVVDPFNCRNAERFRMHIKIHIFLRNSRQIKLPVLDAHRIQITRLYLKYNALYYIAPHSNRLEV